MTEISKMYHNYTLEKAFSPFTEKTAVLIDGANMYACVASIDLFVDWVKLKNLIEKHCQLISMRYYTALHTDKETQKIKVMPMLDFISYNGYVLVTKPTKSITLDDGSERIKGNMDIEITCDAITIANSVDHIVLFTGDGDFCPLLQVLQLQGKKVTIISTISTQYPMIADNLRKQANSFVDIITMADEIRKIETPE